MLSQQFELRERRTTAGATISFLVLFSFFFFFEQESTLHNFFGTLFPYLPVFPFMKITASVLGILSLLIPRACVRNDDKIIREEGRIFSKVSTIFEPRIVMNIERKTALVKDDSFFFSFSFSFLFLVSEQLLFTADASTRMNNGYPPETFSLIFNPTPPLHTSRATKVRNGG